MKAIIEKEIEKEIEYQPNFKGMTTLSDNLSGFRAIATTVYFIGIPIYYAVRKIAKEQSKP